VASVCVRALEMGARRGVAYSPLCIREYCQHLTMDPTKRQYLLDRKQSLHAELSAVRESGLRPGDALPPVRELAARHHLSLRCVNVELLKLVEKGKLYTIPRIGTFIAHPKPNADRGDTVALLCSEPFDSRVEGAPSGWHQAVLSGANAAIHRRECHVLTLHAERFWDEVVLAEDIERLGMRHLAGLVIADMPGHETRLYRLVAGLKKHGVPVVAISDHAAFKNCDRVVSDQEAGAREVTNFLLARGAKNIVAAWVGSTDRYWFPDRIGGYKRAMRAHKCGPLPPLHLSPQPQAGQQEALVGETPDEEARRVASALEDYARQHGKIEAFMANSDGHVSVFAAALRLLGLKPNEDVLLAGYDNYWNDLPPRQREFPPLVTVDKDNWQLGERAVELLFARLDGALPEEARREVVAPRLVPTQAAFAPDTTA